MSGARSVLTIVSIATIVVLVGCSTSQKTMPHLGMGSLDIEAGLNRADLVVLNTVEGESKVTSILGGVVQIIDDNKFKILGIGTFTDKYTYFGEPTGGLAGLLGLIGIRLVNPEDRAYYRALEKTPDADAVLVKSMDRETGGIPFLFETRHVTFRGKAMQMKADQ